MKKFDAFLICYVGLLRLILLLCWCDRGDYEIRYIIIMTSTTTPTTTTLPFTVTIDFRVICDIIWNESVTHSRKLQMLCDFFFF